MVDGLAKRIKAWVEWLEHGYFVVTLFVSIGIGKLVKAIVMIWVDLPPRLMAPTWLLSSGASLFLLTMLGRKFHWHYKRQEIADNEALIKRIDELEQGNPTIPNKSMPVVAVGKPVISVNELQTEAFQFADDLRFWLASVSPSDDPPPVSDESDDGHIKPVWPQHSAYINKVAYDYSEKFGERAVSLYRRFAADDIIDDTLAKMISDVSAGTKANVIEARFEALAIRQWKPEVCELLKQR